METLSINSKSRFSLPDFAKLLSPIVHVELSNDTVTVRGVGSRVYLHTSPESPTADGNWRLFLDYSDINLAKQVLERVADNPSFSVDNDFGTVLSGDAFIARCRNQPGWDWRTDSVAHPEI
ncbi:MAG TPA: hypothetical protein VFE47_23545 [Tepidisphaeraceae bacterium]|jgi:hypothetical protein|nr:hypothetical protein [Tepidisphaeraceae bacterium]